MYALAHAKINIGLSIVEKYPSGLHRIQSVLAPIALSDVIEIIPTEEPQITLHLSGIPVDGDIKENLFYQLIGLLKQKDLLDKTVSLSAHIHKKIPVGAGLGGGSSDVACALNILDNLGMLAKINRENKNSILLQIGSDCPFFTQKKMAFLDGVGGTFRSIDLPQLHAHSLLIVQPPFGIDTRWAYRNCHVKQPVTPLVSAILQPIEAWKEVIRNDFEDVVFSTYPKLRSVKNALYESGAIYASMSGSGSSFFGFFPSQINIHTLKINLPKEYTLIPTSFIL